MNARSICLLQPIEFAGDLQSTRTQSTPAAKFGRLTLTSRPAQSPRVAWARGVCFVQTFLFRALHSVLYSCAPTPTPPVHTGSKAGTAAFADESMADATCAEIALTLSTCNRILTEMHLIPFGLLVEGHTSDSPHGLEVSLDISQERAAAFAGHIAEKLTAYGAPANVAIEVRATGSGKLPSGALLMAKGYGSMRRLPGFDDGGNYHENRRVEIKLLVGDEAEAPSPHQLSGVADRLKEGTTAEGRATETQAASSPSRTRMSPPSAGTDDSA